MDGYELARRLRSSPQTAKTTLIALPGYGQAHDQPWRNPLALVTTSLNRCRSKYFCPSLAALDNAVAVVVSPLSKSLGYWRPYMAETVTFRCLSDRTILSFQ
jgi:CheY-like chemotaxis protein